MGGWVGGGDGGLRVCGSVFGNRAGGRLNLEGSGVACSQRQRLGRDICKSPFNRECNDW